MDPFSRLLDPGVTGFANLKNSSLSAVFFFLIGRDAVQLRDFHSAVPSFWCRYSVPRHSWLAESMVVRVEPLGQDHQLNVRHRTTVRPFLSLPYF